MRLASAVAALCLVSAVCASIGASRRGGAGVSRAPRMTHASIPASRAGALGHPGTANCTELFFTQRLDHYSQDVNAPTYQQRYFYCVPAGINWTPNSPIFFYTGNECNVELYVNMTGLMWENAAQFNAVLVFAEHRYFGKSLPFPGQDMPPVDKLRWLTSDQALEDYANMIYTLKKEWSSPDSAVIAFGGSYGGMLASWFRIKFPGTVDGSIAGSAPIVNFEDMTPAYPADAFAKVVTHDATAAGGATAGCADNVRQSWSDISTLAATSAGRATLSEVFRTCKPIETQDDVDALVNYASACLPNMAMSSYPYPSSYLLLGGAGILPAYPMRVGCKHLGGNFSSPEERLRGFMDLILVYYNATGDFTCLNPESTVNHATAVTDYLWGYLSCATMLMPYGQNGVTDMFPANPWSLSAAVANCVSQYNVSSAVAWPKTQYGGWGVADWGSNIVFSNGGLDPWRPGGITTSRTPNVTTIIIPDVGHHIDLMFSDPADTPAIKAARALEVEKIGEWIAAKKQQSRK
uniref:Uncharacterized protein n=1 Tax=Neobodo designis TaxID=312471 RepID=A0A7S1LPM0_NEODS